MLLGSEVLTRKRPPTRSFGKRSLPLNAAPLFLCIKKCTEREGEERVRQAPWEGEENFKWIFRMQAVGWLVWWGGGKWNESQRKSERRFLLGESSVRSPVTHSLPFWDDDHDEMQRSEHRAGEAAIFFFRFLRDGGFIGWRFFFLTFLSHSDDGSAPPSNLHISGFSTKASRKAWHLHSASWLFLEGGPAAAGPWKFTHYHSNSLTIRLSLRSLWLEW